MLQCGFVFGGVGYVNLRILLLLFVAVLEARERGFLLFCFLSFLCKASVLTSFTLEGTLSCHCWHH